MNFLFSLFNTKTLQQSMVTTVATLINGVLGMIFYILVARLLGPSSFGLFALSVVVITLLSDLGSLGTDTGLIRFIGKNITDKQLSQKFLKLALELKLCVAGVILIVGWLLIPFISSTFFAKPELIKPLQISLLGAVGAMLFSLTTSALQAFQKFISWSYLNIGLNALRLVSLIGLFFAGSLNLDNALVIFILFPFLGFLFGLWLLPPFLKVSGEFSVAKEFLHYNKWVALFILLAAVSSRLDTFLITKLLPSVDLGIYSAANQLVAVIPQLVFAIATVVAPKLSNFSSDTEALRYLKKLQLLMIGLAVLGLLLLPVAVFAIPTLLGEAYRSSIEVFVILFLAQLLFLLALPSHQAIFYYFSKPQLFVHISLIHLLIISLVGWFLTVSLGIYGTAVTVLLGSFSNLVLPLLWVIYKFKK